MRGNSNSQASQQSAAGGGNSRNFAWMLEEITQNLQNFHTTSSTTSNLLHGHSHAFGTERAGRENQNANLSGIPAASAVAAVSSSSQSSQQMHSQQSGLGSQRNDGRFHLERHRFMQQNVSDSSRNSSNHSNSHNENSNQLLQQHQLQNLKENPFDQKMFSFKNTRKKQNSSPKTQDLLTCFICLGKLKNAHMCPDCQKMCCEVCIKEWLRNKTQCPHCRSSLLPSKLMKCRFVLDIAQALEKIEQVEKSKEKQGICQDHGNSLEYFCQKCRYPICSDCGMLGLHKGHTVEKLNTAYESHVALVQDQLEGFSHKLRELGKQRTDLNSVIDNISSQKKSKIEEFSKMMTYLSSLLEDKHKEKKEKLEKQLQPIIEEIDLLEAMTDEVNEQIENLPKSAMIEKSNEIVQTLNEINSRIIINNHIDDSDRKLSFPHEMIPRFSSGVFMLQNYWTKRYSAMNVVFSDVLWSCGNEWRLKVYLNGNDKARDQFLSVFLEMTQGPLTPTNFEYRIEMISQANRRVSEARECVIQFEKGACWGYDKFYAIDKLESAGFLLPEKDTLMLKFQVRYPSFSEHCAAQQKLIQSLEETNLQQLSKIKHLESIALQLNRAQEKEEEEEEVGMKEVVVEKEERKKQQGLPSSSSSDSSEFSPNVQNWSGSRGDDAEKVDCFEINDEQDDQNCDDDAQDADDDVDDGEASENNLDAASENHEEGEELSELDENNQHIDSYDLAGNEHLEENENNGSNDDDDEEESALRSNHEQSENRRGVVEMPPSQQEQHLLNHRLHSIEPSMHWEDQTNKTEQSQSNFADFQEEEFLNELQVRFGESRNTSSNTQTNYHLPRSTTLISNYTGNDDFKEAFGVVATSGVNANQNFFDFQNKSDRSASALGPAPVPAYVISSLDSANAMHHRADDSRDAAAAAATSSNHAGLVASILSGDGTRVNNTNARIGQMQQEDALDSMDARFQEYLDGIGDKVEFLHDVSYTSTKSADVKKNLFSEFEREAIRNPFMNRQPQQVVPASVSSSSIQSVGFNGITAANTTTTTTSAAAAASTPAILDGRTQNEIGYKHDQQIQQHYKGFAESNKHSRLSAATISQQPQQPSLVQPAMRKNLAEIIGKPIAAASVNDDDSLFSSMSRKPQLTQQGINQSESVLSTKKLEGPQVHQQGGSTNVMTPSNSQFDFYSYKCSNLKLAQIHQSQPQLQQSQLLSSNQVPSSTNQSESSIVKSALNDKTHSNQLNFIQIGQVKSRVSNNKIEKVEVAINDRDLFFSKSSQNAASAVAVVPNMAARLVPEATTKRKEAVVGRGGVTTGRGDKEEEDEEEEERKCDGTEEELGMSKKAASALAINKQNIPSQEDLMEKRKQLLNQNNDLIMELRTTKLTKPMLGFEVTPNSTAPLSTTATTTAAIVPSTVSAGQRESNFFAHSSTLQTNSNSKNNNNNNGSLAQSKLTGVAVESTRNLQRVQMPESNNSSNQRKTTTASLATIVTSPALSEGSEIQQQEQQILQLEKLIKNQQKE